MTSGKEYVPAESAIVRIAQAIKDSEEGLWDFAQEYAALNTIPEFNYRALARAVKDQHSVDLYPPSTATKLRKAYERFVIAAKVPFPRIRQYSPYYLYEVSCMTEVTPENADHWLSRIKVTPRAELLEQIRASNPGSHESIAMLRIPENVYDRLQEACRHLEASVGQHVSPTVFLEFTTELILNTKGMQLRRLWDLAHEGPQE